MEDVAFKCLRLRAGLDSQLVHEAPAEIAIDRERIRRRPDALRLVAVSRVDRRTHAVRTIGGVPFANDIAADGRGNIWVSSSAAPVVTRITDGTSNFPKAASPPETIRTLPSPESSRSARVTSG